MKKTTRGGSNQVRVSPQNGQWVVKKIGNTRNSHVVNNKNEAVSKAKAIAKSGKSELFIQKKDGKIQNRNSYGSDPFPPRG